MNNSPSSSLPLPVSHKNVIHNSINGSNFPNAMVIESTPIEAVTSEEHSSITTYQPSTSTSEATNGQTELTPGPSKPHTKDQPNKETTATPLSEIGSYVNEMFSDVMKVAQGLQHDIIPAANTSSLSTLVSGSSAIQRDLHETHFATLQTILSNVFEINNSFQKEIMTLIKKSIPENFQKDSQVSKTFQERGT